MSQLLEAVAGGSPTSGRAAVWLGFWVQCGLPSGLAMVGIVFGLGFGLGYKLVEFAFGLDNDVVRRLKRVDVAISLVDGVYTPILFPGILCGSGSYNTHRC
eukprot:3064473-Rhodomonas_salina.1